jgi:hypothetical protein
VRLLIAAVLCLLVLPATALAKGPTGATITGPGLAEPLRLGGPRALAPGQPLEVLATQGGFFAVAWGAAPGKALAHSPTKPLGPKYRVSYLVPGPSGSEDRIRQDLYPYARGGPVTYTPAGQPFFDGRRTNGGWFRAAPKVTDVLVAAGLPAKTAKAAPPRPTKDDRPAVPLAAWALGGALLVAAAAAFGIRRHGRPASA